jgi:hypothetical protein
VVVGETQGAYGPESTLHPNVEPGVDEVNLKVGVGLLVSPFGPPVIVVFGASGSTAAPAEAGAGKARPRSAPAETIAILLGPIPRPPGSKATW